MFTNEERTVAKVLIDNARRERLASHEKMHKKLENELGITNDQEHPTGALTLLRGKATVNGISEKAEQVNKCRWDNRGA